MAIITLYWCIIIRGYCVAQFILLPILDSQAKLDELIRAISPIEYYYVFTHFTVAIEVFGGLVHIAPHIGLSQAVLDK